ncbi:Slp family lipoprotein [Vibrio cholerae]|uniref:Slp family lipoprotein n=1 Tax=Vibrio cholerae TaxID=666 RepID=A0A7Z7YGV2_VIBCL|nr:Slp family lipoprotein [Vibrio cholerae]ATD26838.1 Starvation lipoprotein [Vibrio cholerae]AYC04851.1 Starvation lipoprotein Slp [Vibrio cholerae]EGQ8579102.1 Slp family lipoprotein [Vibrio cholerae]EGQ9323473.1 Slp family lipoprotein [Vibrio cholerae]EGR0158778.1 Slp family lipoprotein [Vibrio cholerae]
MKMTVLKLLIPTMALLLSACASLPPELGNPDDKSVVTQYSAWLERDPATQSPVRMGGVVANIGNQKDRTRVELVNLPIDSAGRPNIHQEPQGRFVAYVPGFLDPITYGEGRLLTLYGTTAPSEQGKVGDYEHTYPVMNAQGYHLWRVEERVEVDDIGPYMFPCRGFYCWPRTMPERDGKIIQEVK